MLREKAKSFYSQTHGDSNFKASSGWLDNFKRRYGIRQLSITGEKLSSDMGAVEPFKKCLQNKIKELQLSLDQIYNADESGLFFKMLPQKTLAHRSEEVAPGRKMSKERITFMPCANASGSHKLKLLVLGKSKKPRSFGNSNIPVTYKGQKKAWVTKDIFQDWFYTEFIPAVKRKMKELNLSAKAVLLLDNAPGHPQNLCSEDKQIFAIFLPPNVTPLIQPMDQNVIQAVKLHYRKNLLKKIVASETLDISAEIKKINLKDVVHNLHSAWQNVKEELIKKSWNPLLSGETNTDPDNWEEEDEIPLSRLARKCTGSFDSINEDIQEVTQLTKKITGNISNQEIIEWAVGQEESWETLNDDDILENTEIESTSEESEGEIEELVESVSHKEALKCFQTCLKWAHQNNESASNIFLLNEMKKKAEIGQAGKIKQKKITHFFSHPQQT